jgi:acyl carrier protein
MSTPNIDARCRRLIAEHYCVSEEAVTDTADFIKDLDGDSLDSVELVFNIEDEFDIQIPDADAEKLTTARAVIDYVTAATGAKNT